MSYKSALLALYYFSTLSRNMSRHAGFDAVKDEATALCGQLLVGSSTLMYLKKVHWRTSGYVVFSLTVQAVAFQSYLGKVKMDKVNDMP